MFDLIHHDITNFVHYQEVPVTLGAFSEWRSVYVIPINDVKKGDLVQAFAEGEARNDLGYNVEIVQVVEIKHKKESGKEPLGGVYTSPVNGWNITANSHYGRFTKTAAWVANSDYPVVYVTLRVRFRSSNALSNQSVHILPHQGMMFVNQYRVSD